MTSAAARAFARRRAMFTTFFGSARPVRRRSPQYDQPDDPVKAITLVVVTVRPT